MDSYDDEEAYGDFLKPRPLQALEYHRLMTLDLPPVPCVLNPVLPLNGLLMLYAERGVGKTMLALSMAMAVATGTTCLRWKARQGRVVYVDGEMPIDAMQTRLRWLEHLHGKPPEGFLNIISRHVGNIPDIADPTTQAAIETNLEGCRLLVLDNLSTLMCSGVENDAESWNSIQQWLLRLRHKQVAIVIVHHAGKSGQQRGTSKREDVLDTVIALRRPPGYSPGMGARFEVHLEKARSVFGDQAEPFTAQLLVKDDTARWEVSGLSARASQADADEMLATLITLQERGLTLREMASHTGLSKSRIHRLLTSATTGTTTGTTGACED